MNISNREKVMLCILGIIVVGFGYHNFIYTPLKSKVEEMNNKKIEIEDKYNTAIATINDLDNKRSNLKILKSKINDRSSVFYPVISEEHLILELDKLLNDSGLDGAITFEPIVTQQVENSEKESVNLPESSVQGLVDEYFNINHDSDNKKNSSKQTKDTESNFSDSKNSDIDVNNTSNSENSANTNNSNDKKENKIQYVKCAINFKGTYDALNSFLEAIEGNERKIIVNSLSTSQDSLDEINGTMKLEIYSIPKIDDEIESYLKWDFSNTYGKTIPFSSGAATGVVIDEKDSSDFVIAAKSINSDLPSVIMGRASDEERVTYVYADNNGVEDAELILTQDGEKYYYKYKTSKGSYPKDYSGNGAQFTPVLDSSISINVVSEGRVNSNDKSGIKLKITNNTDMLVNVNITDDDNSNPRVTVDGDSSNINVNQK